MNGFTIIPPKQKYMTITEIRDTYGSRGVVAYDCKDTDAVPEGGFVIAVQNKSATEAEIGKLKEYRRQFNLRYPSKAPIYYIRVEAASDAQYYMLTYDNGEGEVTTAQKIALKKTETALKIDRVPDQLLAKALVTVLKIEDDIF